MPDSPVPEKKRRGPKPTVYPEEMAAKAARILREGKLSGTIIHSAVGYPNERSCRAAVCNYMFPGHTEYTWEQLTTWCAVQRMKESTEIAKAYPTVLCGDCLYFKQDPHLTKMPDGKYLRFGTCTDTGQRMERCTRCVHGIYDAPSVIYDTDKPESSGRHIKHAKKKRRRT